MGNFAEWQRQLNAQPVVFFVEDPDGIPTNFYESEEAAAVELTWQRARKGSNYKLRRQPVHSLSLSAARWQR